MMFYRADSTRVLRQKSRITIFLATFVFLFQMAGPLKAQVKITKLPNGVVKYEAPTPNLQPSFWQVFFSLFQSSPKTRPFERSFALLVGVSSYKYFDPQLPYVKTDLEKLREFLIFRAGFDVVYVAADNVVTSELIENLMVNQFPKEIGENDRLLFYYSGHGADIGGDTGYMQFSQAQKGVYSPNQYLQVTRTLEWSKLIKAKHILFLLDSCESGLGFDAKSGSNVDQDWLNTLSGNGSRFVITAGTAREKAFQIKTSVDQGYSVFTHSFLEALESNKGGYTERGFLVLEEVFADSKVRVGRFTSEIGQKMTPRLWAIPRDDKDTGTFVFLNKDVVGVQLSPQAKTAFGIVPKEAADTRRNSSPLASETKSMALKLPAAAYLPGQSEVAPPERAKGIDISHHNNNVSWDDVKSAGYSFVLMKSTQGNSYVDPRFAGYWDTAKRYGLIRGAYHVFTQIQAVDEQAENFLRVADLEPGDLPAIVDVQDAIIANNLRNSVNAPASNRDLIFKLAQFLIQVKTATGRNPIIYTGQSFSRENFDALSSLKDYPLWIAHHSTEDHPNLPPNWPTWTFWQFADNAQIGDGMIVDADYFNGTVDDLKKFAGIP